MEKKQINYSAIVGKLKSFFLNKYIIVLLFFIIWMVFIDGNGYFAHRELDKERNELMKKKNIYQDKYEKALQEYTLLKENKEEREKYARENYFMKRKDEDIFIVVQEQDSLP